MSFDAGDGVSHLDAGDGVSIVCDSGDGYSAAALTLENARVEFGGALRLGAAVGVGAASVAMATGRREHGALELAGAVQWRGSPLVTAFSLLFFLFRF